MKSPSKTVKIPSDLIIIILSHIIHELWVPVSDSQSRFGIIGRSAYADRMQTFGTEFFRIVLSEQPQCATVLPGSRWRLAAGQRMNNADRGGSLGMQRDLMTSGRFCCSPEGLLRLFTQAPLQIQKVISEEKRLFP